MQNQDSFIDLGLQPQKYAFQLNRTCDFMNKIGSYPYNSQSVIRNDEQLQVWNRKVALRKCKSLIMGFFPPI